jgi:maltooligosyltrehalose synthase
VLDPVLWEGTTATLPKPAGERWHDVLRNGPVETGADGLIKLSGVLHDAPLAVLLSTTA